MQGIIITGKTIGLSCVDVKRGAALEAIGLAVLPFIVPDEASQALPAITHCLGRSLLAVYLHGSAVAGGLRPTSDVDLMVVVDRPTTREARKHLAAALMQVSGRHPAKRGDPRPLEVIVFQRSDLSSASYPARCEFLYGEWLRQEFETGVVPEPASDPDFTLVLAQARLNAKGLIGPPPAELLPIIARADIRRAIGEALPGLLSNLGGDERNVLLTLARMWQTLTTGKFVSKDVAAEWAALRLPIEAATLIALARDAYLGIAIDDWQSRQREVRHVANELSERIAAMI